MLGHVAVGHMITFTPILKMFIYLKIVPIILFLLLLLVSLWDILCYISNIIIPVNLF